MKILKLNCVIFVFGALISIAMGSENMREENMDEEPVLLGGRIFCVMPAKTYCLNVLNYPREEIEKLLEGNSEMEDILI